MNSNDSSIIDSPPPGYLINRLLSRFNTRTKILLGFSVPMSLLLIICTVVYFSIGELIETSMWVKHTQKVIADGKELEKLMVDMETGERGFLITGKDNFLEPFNQAKQVWDEKNKAELFANEVNRIQAHLAKNNIAMYMWGDRLLNGKSTGIGKWAASMNDTDSAIDLISKEVIICDWQYKFAPPTPGYFAVKGFNVISASYQVPSVGQFQLSNMIGMRAHSPDTIKNRLQGVMHTYWGSFDSFNQCYQGEKCPNKDRASAVNTFKTIYPETSYPETIYPETSYSKIN